METKEELMNRILKADEEQNGSRDLEEVKRKMSLSNALEAEQIKNEQLRKELSMYNGEFGIHNHFKEMFIKMIEQHEVTDALVAVLEQELPDTEDLVSRVDELEYDKIDGYELIDTVVESMTFESAVEAIVDARLQELTFKVTVEE